MPRRLPPMSFTHLVAALALIVTVLTLALSFATEWGTLKHRVQVLEEFNEWSHGVSRVPTK